MRAEFGQGETAFPLAPSPSPVAARPLRGTAARLLAELVALAGGHGVLLDHRQRAWASVTFSGTRHEITLRFDGCEAVGGANRLIAEAAEYEFTIPGQLVADVAIVSVDSVMLPSPRLTLGMEVLTLDES